MLIEWRFERTLWNICLSCERRESRFNFSEYDIFLTQLTCLHTRTQRLPHTNYTHHTLHQLFFEQTTRQNNKKTASISCHAVKPVFERPSTLNFKIFACHAIGPARSDPSDACLVIQRAMSLHVSRSYVAPTGAKLLRERRQHDGT